MEPILENIARLFGYPPTVVLPWRARRRLRATLSSLFAAGLLAAALLWLCQPALAQFRQVGNMLVSRCDGLGGGYSAALSGDGTTAFVGAAGDTPPFYSAYVYTVTSVAWSQLGCGLFSNGSAVEGAVAVSADGNTVVFGAPTLQLGPNAYALGRVFTRSGGTSSQQVELIGSNVIGGPFGTVVAVSADGNTAIAGVALDSSLTGAAWVFTRSGGVWSQQGGKLVASDAIGPAEQGWSVALSADGNTAIVGGADDNNGIGAAWVFTRSNGVWTQQAKLVGSDAVGNAHQGGSVALSGDGNTAIVGGPNDNTGAGAVWVFTRSGGQWTQQGAKLVGTGAVGKPAQGSSVALSADGNLAIVGGPYDNGTPLGNEVGAAWLFARSDGTWSQLQELANNGEADFPQAFFGASVALSADGRTALVGVPGVVNGGALVFIGPSRRATDAHDFDGDGKSDIAWGDGSGNTGVWLMNGVQVTSAGVGSAPAGWSIVGQRDFNGDGRADWLWRDGSGNVGIWFMNGASAAPASVGTISTAWSVAGTGDFDGDSKGDILWQDTSGNVGLWFMNGAQVTPAGVGALPSGWSIAGTGDFNGDGKCDILLRDGSGNVGIWFMNGAQVTPAAVGAAPAGWSIAGTGDFNGDGKSDILWQDSSGNVGIWYMNGAQAGPAGVGAAPAGWSIVETGDFNGDGQTDILWQHTSGVVGLWFMNGLNATPAGVGSPPAGWSIQRLNAD